MGRPPPWAAAAAAAAASQRRGGESTAATLAAASAGGLQRAGRANVGPAAGRGGANVGLRGVCRGVRDGGALSAPRANPQRISKGYPGARREPKVFAKEKKGGVRTLAF